MNWDTTNIFLYFFINFFDLWVILRYFNSVLKSIKKRRAFLYGLYLLFLLFFTLLIQYELEYSNLVSIALWSCMFLPTYEGGRRNKIRRQRQMCIRDRACRFCSNGYVSDYKQQFICCLFFFCAAFCVFYYNRISRAVSDGERQENRWKIVNTACYSANY